MSPLHGFVRVRRSSPCPICGRPDWCLVAVDGSAAICPRVVSRQRWGEAGYFHRLRPTTCPRRSQRSLVMSSPAGTRGFDELAHRWEQQLSAAGLRELATQLDLMEESLRRLRVGWTGSSYSFPMVNAWGRVCGIRLRLRSGRKLSVRGGREGLFVPARIRLDRALLIAEGPTDTAALLGLGFEVIGRPSCQGGRRLIGHLVRTKEVAQVVIVADAGKPGEEGARRLAQALAGCCAVRVIVPPTGLNDARAWVRAGATQADVQEQIQRSSLLRVRIHATRRGVQHG